MEHKRKFKRMSNHVDTAMVCLDNIRDLSPFCLELIFRISLYADDKNIIRNLDGGYIYTLNELAEMLGISHANESLNELSKKGVIKHIGRGREKRYVINPYVLYRGKSIDVAIYTAFKDSKYRYVYGEDYFEEVLV